jgi:lipoyl(octanoyl) transferase
VCYPIFKLGENHLPKNLPTFISQLSSIMIKTLKTFEIDSFEGGNDRVGIWVDDKKKIGFLGVSFSKWVSMHGFSLNVSNDLSIFDNIIPCGLNNIEITSMEKELQKQVMMEKVVNEIVKNFEIEFQRKVQIDHEEEE